MKKIITLASMIAIALCLLGCVGGSANIESAGAGNISFEYPEGWVLTTEADIKDLGNTQILGQKPLSIASVGPAEDTSIVFTAFYIPDFEYKYEDLKNKANTTESTKVEIVTIGEHEAIKTTQTNDILTKVNILPNIDGKITSVFAASYPKDDAECIAVVDSVTVADAVLHK